MGATRVSLRFAWAPEICGPRGPSHSPNDGLGLLFFRVVSRFGNPGHLGPVCVPVERISVAARTPRACCRRSGQVQEPCHCQPSSQGLGVLRPFWDITDLKDAHSAARFP